MLKRFRFLLPGMLILGSAASAQWVAQQSNFPAGVAPHTISAVNEQVAWAFGFKLTNGGFSECTWFSRTLDGGQTWTAERSILPDTAWITSIQALSADTAWISVMTNSITTNAGPYRTVDGGKTWEHRASGFDTVKTFFHFLHFFDANDGIAVLDPVSNYPLIYTTDDGGASWQRLPDADNIPLLYREWLNIHMYSVAEGVIYIGTGMPTGGRILKSSDRGKSWSVSKCDFPTTDDVMIWPGFKDADNGMIAALTPGARGVGAAITHDGGSTWRITSPPPISAHFATSIPGTAAGYLVAGANWWSPSLPIYPGSAFTLDNGDTWTKIDDTPYNNPVFASRHVGWVGDPNSTIIYKWQIGQQAALGCYPRKPLNFNPTMAGGVSQSQEVSLTNYGQAPLVISELSTGSNASIKREFALPLTLYSLQTARIRISFVPVTGGKITDSVLVVSNAANTPNYGIHFEGEGVALAPAQAGLLYGISANSLYTIDPATAQATLIGKSPFTSLQGLAVEPASLTLTSPSATATFTYCYGLDGATATTAAILGILPVGYLRAIAFKADTLFGATPTGKFYRLNLPAAEATLLGTAPGVFYLSISVQPGTGHIFASIQSTDSKIKDVIATVNPADGDTTLLGATGDGKVTPSIAFSPGGILYGLKGTGTEVNTLVTIDPKNGTATLIGSTGVSGLRAIAWAPGTTFVKEQIETVPCTFSLMQNYPNPFNSQTTLEFTLEQSGWVRMEVCNLLGERVAVLADGSLPMGKHQVAWAGHDHTGRAVPSGIYYITLRSGQHCERRKMLLLR